MRSILRHPGVAEVAVVGVPDERLGEVAMAFVVPRPGLQIDPDQLIAWARAEMANFKGPRHAAVLDALPINRQWQSAEGRVAGGGPAATDRVRTG